MVDASVPTDTEPFPALPTSNKDVEGGQPQCDDDEDHRPEETVSVPSTPRRDRRSSLRQSFLQSNPPLGMWQATGEISSKFPTLPEIRDGQFSDEGWSQEGQMENRGANPHDIHRVTQARRSSVSARGRKSSTIHRQTFDGLKNPLQLAAEENHNANDTMPQNLDDKKGPQPLIGADLSPNISSTQEVKGPDETGTYPNGYRFPKKHTWGQSFAIGLRAFWKFVLTPTGFLITLYGLNVVGWGAMIFFVLLEAVAPGMCVPTCSDTNSPRQIWIEIDSQVLNGLFCVTGFGLIPWRFRDFYYLMKWRCGRDHTSHRRLAGIYRGWYRLPGSQDLPDDVAPLPLAPKKGSVVDDSSVIYSEHEKLELEANEAVPLPVSSIPDPPLTGLRAPTTRSWNLDIVIWMYLWNTLIQAALAGIMWGLNRHNRPSWATGFLISLGCITGIVAGIVVFIEGSKVKKVEGVPVQEYDVLESVDDYQARQAKENAKKEKQAMSTVTSSHQHHLHLHHTEKVKGASWFTRH